MSLDQSTWQKVQREIHGECSTCESKSAMRGTGRKGRKQGREKNRRGRGRDKGREREGGTKGKRGGREREGESERERRGIWTNVKPNIDQVTEGYSTYSHNLLRLTTNHRMSRMVYQQDHLVL